MTVDNPGRNCPPLIIMLTAAVKHSSIMSPLLLPPWEGHTASDTCSPEAQLPDIITRTHHTDPRRPCYKNNWSVLLKAS